MKNKHYIYCACFVALCGLVVNVCRDCNSGIENLGYVCALFTLTTLAGLGLIVLLEAWKGLK